MVTKSDVINDLDDVIQIIEKTPTYSEDFENYYTPEHLGMLLTKFWATLERNTLPNSSYRKNADKIISQVQKEPVYYIQQCLGILKALKDDIVKGYFEKITELIHADTSINIQEMAQDLFDIDHVDAAAMVIGTALELHLKNICTKFGISLVLPSGKNKTASSLNNELYTSRFISRSDNKDIISWQDIRNDVAHGIYGKHPKEKIELVIKGINLFLKQNPA